MIPDRVFMGYLEEAIGKDNARIAFSAFEEEPATSVRLNPFKPGADFGCGSTQVPWSRYGLMLDSRPRFTLDPMLHAGGYYVQDSSAMFPGYIFRKILQKMQLPGDRPLRVLDLCAAPGGKTTDLAASLRLAAGERFLLVANEVMRQRAGILADNVRIWGDPNVMVTSSDPEAFGRLKGFFDIILADVPCSGEGMFRKDPEAVAQWSEETVNLCQARQKRIIADVWDALADGGMMIYSTCTFNRAENDMNIDWLLGNFVGTVFSEPLPESEMPGVMRTEYGYLLVPGLVKGEGQYCSAVIKSGNRDTQPASRSKRRAESRSGNTAGSALKKIIPENIFNTGVVLKEKNGVIKAVPAAIAGDEESVAAATAVLVSGCAAGTVKGKDLVPSPDLALSLILSEGAFPSADVDRPTALSYLHRDQINPPCPAKGHNIVRYGGLALGFIKNIGNRCNNLHPMSRRIRMDIDSHEDTPVSPGGTDSRR